MKGIYSPKSLGKRSLPDARGGSKRLPRRGLAHRRSHKDPMPDGTVVVLMVVILLFALVMGSSAIRAVLTFLGW